MFKFDEFVELELLSCSFCYYDLSVHTKVVIFHIILYSTGTAKKVIRVFFNLSSSLKLKPFENYSSMEAGHWNHFSLTITQNNCIGQLKTFELNWNKYIQTIIWYLKTWSGYLQWFPRVVLYLNSKATRTGTLCICSDSMYRSLGYQFDLFSNSASIVI